MDDASHMPVAAIDDASDVPVAAMDGTSDGLIGTNVMGNRLSFSSNIICSLQNIFIMFPVLLFCRVCHMFAMLIQVQIL
jgi:hypothetical protein